MLSSVSDMAMLILHLVGRSKKNNRSSHVQDEAHPTKSGAHMRAAPIASAIVVQDDVKQSKGTNGVVAAAGNNGVRKEVNGRNAVTSSDKSRQHPVQRPASQQGVKRVRSSTIEAAEASLPRSASTQISQTQPYRSASGSMELDEAKAQHHNNTNGHASVKHTNLDDESMTATEDEEEASDEDYSSSEEDEEAQSGPSRSRHPSIAEEDGASISSADDQDDLDFNPDPECLVTLPAEFQEEALHKVALISARFEQEVVLPQMAKASQDRRDAVRAGELSPDVAAHDDELAQMGLDPEDVRDTSMVAEYAKEIFGYMGKCEMETMANPNYMVFQNEIQWHMRATLVDWLLQVHMRYHMLPETLFIAINIIDRFLSVRVVSLAKLQLVGVIAMFIAAKYEEIVAPSVEEFVAMTEGGHSKDEIFKGERIILSTLDFKISTYCSPYSWVRKISKADDYDIQVRTLAKFLMEVTLLDHRFLRAKPSLVAAISMFLSKKMLGGQWDEGFVFYSGFCEEQLIPGANLLLEKLVDPAFEDQFVCRKYAARKFLKASLFARDWAKRNTFGRPASSRDGAQANDNGDYAVPA